MILVLLTVAISAATGFLPTLLEHLTTPSKGAVDASVLVLALAVIRLSAGVE